MKTQDIPVVLVQVGNMLHGQRFKLQESLRKLQVCMNLLEKERIWEEHVNELSGLMQQHQAVVQVKNCTAILISDSSLINAQDLQHICKWLTKVMQSLTG